MEQNIVIVGFGSVAQGLIPLIRRAFPQMKIVAFDQDAGNDKRSIARACDVAMHCLRISEENFRETLRHHVNPGDILLNLATEVCSLDLIDFAQGAGAIYLDTNIERWPSDKISATSVSNYALREEVLAKRQTAAGQATAVVAHGANPGFVSILIKQALIEMAVAVGVHVADATLPERQEEWAQLASDLGIRVIQISENDTQVADCTRAADVFFNTWSVSGFVTECLQAAEVGWGTHEPRLPEGAQRHHTGSQAAISLASAGHRTIVQSWSPLKGPFRAMVLTHNESISIAEYLSLADGGSTVYRPTVFYAYRPIDLAVDSLPLLAAGRIIGTECVLKSEITAGEDELGVLLISDRHPSFWLGSALGIDRTRKLAPYNNATTLQVTSSIVAALQWAMRNPRAGIVESEQMDHTNLYAETSPYWEPMQRCFTDWPHEDGLCRPARLNFESFLRSGTSVH